jgi:hypothetical protein
LPHCCCCWQRRLVQLMCFSKATAVGSCVDNNLPPCSCSSFRLTECPVQHCWWFNSATFMNHHNSGNVGGSNLTSLSLHITDSSEAENAMPQRTLHP